MEVAFGGGNTLARGTTMWTNGLGADASFDRTDFAAERSAVLGYGEVLGEVLRCWHCVGWKRGMGEGVWRAWTL